MYDMPASEFTGWQAYFSIYPFAFQQRDYNAALLAAVITNNFSRVLASVAGKKKFDSASVEDFLPGYLRTEKPADPDPMQRSVYASLKTRLAEMQGPTSSES